MENVTPPPAGSSKLKIAIYVIIVALIAIYAFVSCSSLRRVYHHCDPESGCTTYIYDSTIINKIP